MKIETAEIKQSGPQSKNPGTEYLNMRCRITDGPDRSKAIFQNFQLEGGFRFLFEDLCVATGVANREDFAIEDFVGMEFEAELKRSEFNGRVNAEVKKIYVSKDATAPSEGKKDADYPF